MGVNVVMLVELLRRDCNASYPGSDSVDTTLTTVGRCIPKVLPISNPSELRLPRVLPRLLPSSGSGESSPSIVTVLSATLGMGCTVAIPTCGAF